MYADIRKLTSQQVKEILEAAGWAWDDAKSIEGEQNRRDCESLVNEAYMRGFKAGINAKTQVAAVVAAAEEAAEIDRLREKVDALEKDAAKYRWGIKNARWIRGEHAAYVAIPVAREADLSCVAMIEAAIDEAMEKENSND